MTIKSRSKQKSERQTEIDIWFYQNFYFFSQCDVQLPIPQSTTIAAIEKFQRKKRHSLFVKNAQFHVTNCTNFNSIKLAFSTLILISCLRNAKHGKCRWKRQLKGCLITIISALQCKCQMRFNWIQFQERISAVKGLRFAEYKVNCGIMMIKIQLNSNNKCHKKQSVERSTAALMFSSVQAKPIVLNIHQRRKCNLFSVSQYLFLAPFKKVHSSTGAQWTSFCHEENGSC